MPSTFVQKLCHQHRTDGKMLKPLLRKSWTLYSLFIYFFVIAITKSSIEQPFSSLASLLDEREVCVFFCSPLCCPVWMSTSLSLKPSEGSGWIENWQSANDCCWEHVDFLQKPMKGLKRNECRPGPNLQIFTSCYSLYNLFKVLKYIFKGYDPEVLVVLHVGMLGKHLKYSKDSNWLDFKRID